MVADGFTITRAIQSRSWPASSANLEYAAAWGTLSPVADDVPRVADDIEVRRISTLLEPVGRAEGNPIRLNENSGIAHMGSLVLGMGFTVTPDVAAEWISLDPRNDEVLFPYLNGENLNQRPDASAARWIVDFDDQTDHWSADVRLSVPAAACERVVPECQSLANVRSTCPERFTAIVGGSLQRSRCRCEKRSLTCPRCSLSHW
ncbi:hypothetical protein OG738_44145 [Amycolatopsis sp. NBC_01488]|uniref:hypothetical protein n=1 Tax=Amycolatopsis sp. NBC_01488 TaxID=2903563 RepID=UPI002E2B4AD7|nr:hypothetical protein [Amycolatopsis sp. NBC_01488]